MKKIITIALALVLIASMTVTTYAATPKLNIDLPEIPNISGSVKIDVTPAVNKWLDEHPVKIDFSKIKWGWN
jgi:uncharacterized protein (DUF2141 family)